MDAVLTETMQKLNLLHCPTEKPYKKNLKLFERGILFSFS